MIRIIKWTLIISIGLFILLSVVLSSLDPDASHEPNYPDTSPNTATIILIDGLSKKIFQEELVKGNLPNLDKLIHKSTYIQNGIASFPSMTGYGFYPFITGQDAANSGIFGLRWFDRSRTEGNLRNYVGRTNIHMNEDLNTKSKNIFEIFDPFYTASINTYMNKGVHHSIKTGWSHTSSKYNSKPLFQFLRKWPLVGRKIAKNNFEHESLITDLAIQQLSRNPKAQWITYPSLDAHNHIHGTDQIYVDLLHHLDREIGRLLEEISKKGQSDRMIAIISDHGVQDVTENIDIINIAKDKIGLNLHRGKSVSLLSDQLDTPLSDFSEKDGYFVINGNLSAYLYMTDPSKDDLKKWGEKSSRQLLEHYPVPNGKINLPDFISTINGIDVVAYQSTIDQVTVMRNGLSATISQNADQSYTYKYTNGDPLSTNPNIQVDSAYNQLELLQLSQLDPYPYAIPRLYDLLSQSNSPDMVVTSKPGYDLAKNYELFVGNFKGGHGGLHANLLNVPYIIYRPGLEAQLISVARSEDIGAGILDYLGIESEESLDGEVEVVFPDSN